MGVYGYADDISLLCPTASGMKEMLKTCETFAKQHDILFNASKSQLLWFGKGKKPIHISLKMENGQVIPYVDSCKHLGNEISMNRMNVFINNATNDLHCRLNSLLAEFSLCDSVTLSTLFKTYCMNCTAAKCGDTMIKLLVHFIHFGERLYADYITSLIVHIIF